LKFRQSKNHRQRIIAFVGSPISTSKEEVSRGAAPELQAMRTASVSQACLAPAPPCPRATNALAKAGASACAPGGSQLTKMGKKFKKDNVAVDVINFGTEEDNVEKLTAFVEAVDNKNSERRSHFLNVPSGVGQLSEHIMQSPICDTPDSGGGGGGGGGSVADAGFGGVDANMDPELALALRVSMEEERERQAKAAREAGEPAADAAGDAAEATNIEGAGMQDAVAAQLQEMEQAPDAGGVSAPCRIQRASSLTLRVCQCQCIVPCATCIRFPPFCFPPFCCTALADTVCSVVLCRAARSRRST